MSDAFEDTSLFKRLKATPSAPDQIADKVAAQIAFDEVLTPLGVRAPAPEPRESDTAYLARLGETAAAFGPEDRKGVDRYKLPPAALAEFVREDLDIARQEVERPNYSLKPGVLAERRRPDASGREFIEFYSKDGPSVWMDQFKGPINRYVSGGSNGILDSDHPSSPTHKFMRSHTIPELVELKRRQAYADSAEGKIIAAYEQAGLPPERVGEVILQLRRRSNVS